MRLFSPTIHPVHRFLDHSLHRGQTLVSVVRVDRDCDEDLLTPFAALLGAVHELHVLHAELLILLDLDEYLVVGEVLIRSRNLLLQLADVPPTTTDELGDLEVVHLELEHEP